jgi:hypothetical protein
MRCLKRLLLNPSMPPSDGEECEADNNEKNYAQQKTEKDREFSNVRGVRARGVPHRLNRRLNH